MRLASLNEFRRLFFTPESAPSLSTLRQRIRNKKIPGGRMEGGKFYVDLDEYDTITHFSVKLEQRRKQLADDPVLQGLI